MSKLKMVKEKIRSPFIIYANFKSVLVPEDNRKQSQDESSTNKFLIIN